MENYFNKENLEWLQKRLGRFTASEIHKLFVSGKKKGELFGQGAMTYIRSKVAELLTMDVKEELDFKQAEWGKANERDGVLEMEAALGIKGNHYGIIDPQFFTYGDYAGGSPDWECGKDGADIKCPYNSAEHVKNLMLQGAYELSEERWEYYCQGQMNMHIRGWERFHFVSYDPRMVEHKHRLKIITVYPDSEWLKEFHVRLNTAIDVINSTIALLEHPSVLIATRTDNAVLIEKA